MAGPSPASGTKISIGTTAAVALTDAYTLIGSLNSVSEYGPQFGDITFEDLSTGLVEHFKGARDDGTIQVGLGNDITDAGQVALRAALLQKDNYNFKVEYNDAAPPVSATVTISQATPGIVSWAAHGFLVNTPVKFTTTGVLPTGLVAGTTYYVVAPILVGSFAVAATPGGAAIATTTAGSGVHTGTTVPAPTFDYLKAKVNSFKKNPGNLQSVVMAMAGLILKSGSLDTVVRIPAPPV